MAVPRRRWVPLGGLAWCSLLFVSVFCLGRPASAWAGNRIGDGELGEGKAAAGTTATGNSWNGVSRRWVAATAQQLALVAERRGQQLSFRACAKECGDGRATTLSVPEVVDAQLLGWTVLTLRDGKRLLHGVAPKAADGRVFQVLVAAAPERRQTILVLFADWTVPEASSGSSSSKTFPAGKVLRVESVGAGHRVLTGVVQSRLSLCGRSALLNPRLLVSDDLVFHGAKLQRLSLAEREGASRISVHAISPSQAAPVEMFSGVLRSVGASSGKRAPSLLTDGDLRSGWGEARGGDGRGEFVVFEVAEGASLQSVDLLMRGHSEPRDGRVGPRRAWLATSEDVFALEFGQDGWEHPGQWYRAEFEPRLDTSCLALVLEDGYRDSAEVEVSFTEIRGVSPEADVPSKQLVENLSVPGAAGDLAEYWLSHRGRAGVDAVSEAFAQWRGPARERAWRLLKSGQCEVTNHALAKLLTSAAERDRERAASLLRRCPTHRERPLQRHFESISAAERLIGLRILASLEPVLAARLAIQDLRIASDPDSRLLRDVLSRAGRSRSAVPVIRVVLADGEASPEQSLSILRSLSEPIARFEPEASRAAHRAVTEAAGFREKYLLVEPVGMLLRSGRPTAEGQFLSRFLLDQATADDPYLRARATEFLPVSDSFVNVLVLRLQDSNPRVRQAALTRSVAFASERVLDLIVDAGLGDDWPFVRLAAVQALAHGPPSARADRALWQVQQDDVSVEVRSASIRALASRGAFHLSGELVALFTDKDEPVAIRASAAEALGALCVQPSAGPLLDAVLTLGSAGPAEESDAIGRAALRAVVRLQPPGLQQALAPLLNSNAPGHVRLAVRAAQQVGDLCYAESK